MNSAVHHSLSPLQLQVPPGSLSASRVHFSLTYGSLNVSQSSKRSHLVSSPLQMNCKLHAFSEWSNMNGEERGKNNLVRGVGGASLSMAGVLGAFSPNGKMMNSKPIMACSGQYPHNAEGPLMGVLQEMMTNRNKNFVFGGEPNRNQIEELKFYAMTLSTKDPERAVEIMRKERERWAGREAEGNLLMALIELLLSQGKYQEAKETIQDLMKDAMAESEADITKAAASWEEYQRKASEETSPHHDPRLRKP
ncbi:uncharacterized protein LOC129306831 isoform X2 [Prosopis cineraria]|uniref:uncharacterized protein LOC129306831 isoform X2 n=1 Tax=Prosopis cineraria TaxID=364024 RepID=UPI00240EB737|nr:uncharacterized protein LOC129306831 isoform X2 [Prosopis cineraria]